jgi:hypothetical protein
MAENKTKSKQVNKLTKPIETEEEEKKFETIELLQALYFIWEAAERGQLDIFLIGNTARQVLKDEDLQGKVTLGVRKNEWVSGQGSIFRNYIIHTLGHFDNTDKLIEIIYMDIPITIKIYDENPTLQGLDTVMYRYENFNLPNPFNDFAKNYE